MYFLAKLMAVLTGHPRYFPKIKWANKSWTHNVFRVYEMIFGRRYGIKAEMSAIFHNGKTYYACHSSESAFALTEQYIRALLLLLNLKINGLRKYNIREYGIFDIFKLIPFKIYIPVLQTPQGFPVFASPYLFAIALDNNQGAYGATTATVSFTCTGSNLLLMTGGASTNASDPFVSMKYNGVDMTAVNPNYLWLATTNWAYHYYLIAPATGTHDAVLVANNNWLSVLSYSGVSQSAFPDSKNTATGTGTTLTATTNVVAPNCWLTMYCPMYSDTVTAGAGTTMRNTGVDSGRAQADSNGTVGTGNQSLVTTSNLSGSWYGSICSIAPPSVAVISPSIESDIIFFN